MRSLYVPGQPMITRVLRLPGDVDRRLKARAARNNESVSALLRRYIDAGDHADTQHEETTP